jgi:hypothetical protein
MRIYEIIFWDNDPAEESRSIPNLDIPGPLDNDLAHLARAAFTRSGLVKHLWYTRGSEEQVSGPTPLNGAPDVIPKGSLEPTTASVPAKPVEEEPLVDQYSLVPLRQPKGLRQRTSPTL